MLVDKSSVKIKWCNIMELDINNHSVFKVNYNLVLAIKYRRKVVDDEISTRLKDIFD